MFDQVNNVFQTEMANHSSQVQREFASTHTALATNLQVPAQSLCSNLHFCWPFFGDLSHELIHLQEVKHLVYLLQDYVCEEKPGAVLER